MVLPTSPQMLPAVSAASLQALLSSEQDRHRRQLALVRASLVLCPPDAR